jgi:sodium transport system ATP-binding protein
VIEVSQLTKVFKDRKRGKVEALRGVSFTCRPGEVFGLLGPNGAGKTTTLRIISTALQPTTGGGKVMGYDLLTQSAHVRKSIGFLSGNTGLYGRLTAREVLTYFGRLFRLRRHRIRERIAELSEAFRMSEFLDRPCDKLSSGMRQKVNIARTVFHSPPVMVFDEPTSGLDVLTSRAIVEFIQACKREQRTILFSTHIMPDVHKLCDRVAVIHEGRMCFCGPVDEIRRRYGEDMDEAFIRMIQEAA